ncbi:luciferase-like monooxygenase family protein [Mycobacterium xenopi 3993]|nr:luciferase-like monooxygenase family protein [Mycobacterium xenopi 3993]
MSTYGISVVAGRLRTLGTTANAADRAGFDAIWASEFYVRSGTISMAVIAAQTRTCRIGSSILYGIGRSPLVLATEARDLDELSGGRIVLGIGNGTKRMMNDWHGIADTSAPALRIEELVPLVRRIWHLHEGPIHHEGRFYRLNLLPTGAVEPPQREIPIFTAGVRPGCVKQQDAWPMVWPGIRSSRPPMSMKSSARPSPREPPTLAATPATSRSSRWSCVPSTTTRR